jgi:ATP-dependent helicase/nuclease subunit B
MPPVVTLLSGPAGSGKTQRLLQRFREVVGHGLPGRTLWLAPTSRAASEIQHRLLGETLRACFAPGISTFARFATSLLARSPRPMRPLNQLMQRQLVSQIVQDLRQAGRLEHFGPIASTAGLLDLVCQFVRQMKRLEIWPEQFAEACRRRGMDQKDIELLAIYDAYQRRLLDHNLYDAEGRFWSARDLLHRQPLGFELVVVDGFSDFTRTEHDMLQALADKAGETWISLPLEAEPEVGNVAQSSLMRTNKDHPPLSGREDLFQEPLRTREELRRRHSNLHEEHQPRPENPAWPALAHLERTVFSNPRGMKPATDTQRLEILVCGRQLNEIETVGRRIKQLLIEGDSHGTHHAERDAYVRPGQIAVVFRQPQAVADLVSEVFQRLQIPLFLECGRPLARSPALVMLVRLLELDAADWPMQKLLNVLGNNYFSPVWAAWDDLTASDAERAIRSLQIPHGRNRLLEQLSAVGGSSPRSTHPTPASEVYRVLRGLADAFDQLPRSGSLAEHARAWAVLAEQIGIHRTMRDDADRSAWEQLQQSLGENQQLTEWLGEDAPRLDRAQARAALLDLLHSQTLERADEESGRVRVLSASSVRHLKTPYLFLAGLSEKSFPAADGDDGVYRQAERQRLIEDGLPLPTRGDRQSQEMLLFYEAVNAATRRLWLSYPAVDDSGEPLNPSPYLKEIEQACGTTPIARQGQIDLSPIPRADDLCSPDAFRIRAVADALSGKPESLGGFAVNDVRGGENLFRGLGFGLSRQNREKFDLSEGMLSAAVEAELKQAFPPDRVYSATELEHYAYCPYRYFLEKLLNVQPLEDIALETDYARRGQMAHSLLAVFHRRVNEARRGPGSPANLTEDDFSRILQEAAGEALGASGGDSLAGAFHEIDRRKLLEWFTDYRRQHASYDDLWKACDSPPLPELFEVSFGRALREGEGPPSTADALALTSREETVQLSGRIDRIDVGKVGSQTVFNILDYKTGGAVKFTPEACQRGNALQLPVYALAAGELILNDRDAVPWQAGYWQLKDGGFKPRQALRMHELSEGSVEPTEVWEQVRSRLADTIVSLVQAMRRGEFPVWSDDEDCTGRCPYKTVCRINQVRSLKKTWRP